MTGIYTEKLNDPALGGQSAYVLRYMDITECVADARARHDAVNGTSRHRNHRRWDNAGVWYGYESKAQAADYAMRGNETLVAVAEQYMAQIEAAGIETTRAHWDPSLCGAYPIVPEFLAGRPDCMRRRYDSTEERHPVRVYANTTSSAGISAAALQKRGAAILAFVMALAQERPVELWQIAAIDARGYGKNYGGLAVRLPTAPLNIGVCAHALTSQAWTRGIGYDYPRSLESGGAWPFGLTPSHPDFTAYNRHVLDMSAEDVFIPAIHLHDELIKDPVSWINRELRHIRATEHDD